MTEPSGEGSVLRSATDRRALRVNDYIELTKPRLTTLSVLTTLAGYYIGSDGVIRGDVLLHTLLGSFLVGGGCGALNMYMEHEHDSRMRRTAHRPIPAGRLTPLEVLVFGVVIGLGGIAYLGFGVNPLTGALGAVTMVSYLMLYTPLKRLTTLNTLVGAIPGAIPPMMGWAAATGNIGQGPGGWVLFGILFFWQMPHFLSLAWMCREDYARAGYRMLAVIDTDGRSTSMQILLYTTTLIPVSLLPTTIGIAGSFYFYSALVLGLYFLFLGIRVARYRAAGDARKLFHFTLMYLPLLLLILAIDS